MLAESSAPTARRAEAFPRRLFSFIVGLVCLGLALNAAYSFHTLARFREEFLHSRGSDIAADLDRQMRGPGPRGPGMRGPGMRSDPSVWQSSFDEALADYRDSTAFLALVDASGRILAFAGATPREIADAGPGFHWSQGSELFVVDYSIGSGRAGRIPQEIGAAARQLRVGLYANAADFIRRQAYVQVGVSAVAIAALVLLTSYLLGTLSRFLELKAREESARHLAALGSMAATLAHEIRNPLGAMKGLTQLAQENLPRGHDAQQFMGTVVREAERLEGLVNSLLTFAKPRPPSVSPFDLGDLLEEVRIEICARPECAGRQVRVQRGDRPLVVESDPNGLRQIFLNVLLNALEATPEAGEVQVEAERNEARGLLEVRVDDTGPGLGERDPDELFEPFLTTKTKGTGLGLAVSRQIAHALGGTLTLANRPGGGARCVLTIPNGSLPAPRSRRAR